MAGKPAPKPTRGMNKFSGTPPMENKMNKMPRPPMPNAATAKPARPMQPGKPTTLPNRAPSGVKPAGPRPGAVKKFLQKYQAGMQ